MKGYRWLLMMVTMGSAMGWLPAVGADEPAGAAERKPLARTLTVTRAHVLPAGEVEFEQWWRVESPRDGSATHRFLSELEMGLPGRLHLAVYEVAELNAQDTFRHKGVNFEGRWAVADYGKLLLNPTVYGEWIWNDEAPDKFEVKLLLAEDITDKLWWAFNVIYEQEVSGGRETELGFSQALMYKLNGRNLAAGVEMQYLNKTEEGSRDNPADEFVIGPSVLWKIHNRVKLKASSLFGVTGDSPQVLGFVVVEVELWEPAGH